MGALGGVLGRIAGERQGLSAPRAGVLDPEWPRLLLGESKAVVVPIGNYTAAGAEVRLGWLP